MRVWVSGPTGIVGGGSECPALSPPSIPRLRWDPWLPTAPGVCSQHMCVCSLLTTVCVHFNGLNAEHKFQVWVTILGNLSFHFLSFPFLSFPFLSFPVPDRTGPDRWSMPLATPKSWDWFSGYWYIFAGGCFIKQVYQISQAYFS